MENKLFEFPAIDVKPYDKTGDGVPDKLKSPPVKKQRKKPEVKTKIVYREPELSDRQKKYQEWMKKAIQIKQQEFQNWPTHMEVQGARVYKQAGDLMSSCTEYKGLKKLIQEPDQLFYRQQEEIVNLMTQCCRNIAANIRFLERLHALLAPGAELEVVTYRDLLGPYVFGPTMTDDERNPEAWWI